MNNHELHQKAQELTDTTSPYQLARKLVEAERNVEKFKDIAKESQGWDWLSAQDESDELGIEHYTIDHMQELHEAVFGKEVI